MNPPSFQEMNVWSTSPGECTSFYLTLHNCAILVELFRLPKSQFPFLYNKGDDMHLSHSLFIKIKIYIL